MATFENTNSNDFENIRAKHYKDAIDLMEINGGKGFIAELDNDKPPYHDENGNVVSVHEITLPTYYNDGFYYYCLQTVEGNYIMRDNNSLAELKSLFKTMEVKMELSGKHLNGVITLTKNQIKHIEPVGSLILNNYNIDDVLTSYLIPHLYS